MKAPERRLFTLRWRLGRALGDRTHQRRSAELQKLVPREEGARVLVKPPRGSTGIPLDSGQPGAAGHVPVPATGIALGISGDKTLHFLALISKNQKKRVYAAGWRLNN